LPKAFCAKQNRLDILRENSRERRVRTGESLPEQANAFALERLADELKHLPQHAVARE